MLGVRLWDLDFVCHLGMEHMRTPQVSHEPAEDELNFQASTCPCPHLTSSIWNRTSIVYPTTKPKAMLVAAGKATFEAFTSSQFLFRWTQAFFRTTI